MIPTHLNSIKACALICSLLAASPAMVVADVSDTSNTNKAASSNEIYVDSVYNWGAWEFNIQPAAGGVHAPAGQALTARPARISANVNSVAAISPSIIAPTTIAPPDAISSGIITTLTGTNVAPVGSTTTIPPGTGGLF